MPGKKKGGKRKAKSSSKSSSALKAARAALNSASDEAQNLPVPPTAREKLVDLLQKNEVKDKEIFNVKVSVKVLQNLSSQDIKDLKEIFEMLDVKKVGSLNLTDLRRAFWILGFKPSREDVYEMMRDSGLKGTPAESRKGSDAQGALQDGASSSVSQFRTGRCDLNLFLELVIDCQSNSRDRLAELQTAFNLFDIEDTGLVTIENLSALNKKHAAGLTEDELKEMLEFADFRGDGVLDVQEFARVIGQTNLFEGVTLPGTDS